MEKFHLNEEVYHLSLDEPSLDHTTCKAIVFQKPKHYWKKTVEELQYRAKNQIVLHRNKFTVLASKKMGPFLMPTIFKNHPERRRYLLEKSRGLHSEEDEYRVDPWLPFYDTSFADAIYTNICENLKLDSLLFLKHPGHARFIRLHKKTSAERTMEELLSRLPYCYSYDREIFLLSKHADLDEKNWKEWKVSKPCGPEQNHANIIIVDFAYISHDENMSTVYVMCQTCGKTFETLVNQDTFNLVKNNLMHNLQIAEFLFDPSEGVSKAIIRLPTYPSYDLGCCFGEGCIGATLIVGEPNEPACFIRTRLTYYCTVESPIHSMLHSGTECTNQ